MKLHNDQNYPPPRNVSSAMGTSLHRPQTGKPFVKSAKQAKPSKKVRRFSPFDVFDEEPIEFNDFDSNMLNRNLFKFLPSDNLRLELQLERSENLVKKIDEELEYATILQLEDDLKIDFLEKKRNLLIEKIQQYRQEYRNLGIMYKIADFLSVFRSFLSEKIKLLKKNSIIKKILQRMPNYRQREKLYRMNIIHRKIKDEVFRNRNPDSKKLEKLFMKKEEFL